MAEKKGPAEPTGFEDIVKESKTYEAAEARQDVVELVGQVRQSAEEGIFVLLIPGAGGLQQAVEVSPADVSSHAVAFEDSSGEKSYSIRLAPTAQVKVLMQASDLAQPTKAIDPKIADPKGFEPKRLDPKQLEPKQFDPKLQDPKQLEPKQFDPKLQDPKQLEPKQFDPKLQDPKQLEPKQFDPKLQDPKQLEPKALDPKGIDPKGDPGPGPFQSQTSSPVGPFVLTTYWPY